jgi:hypothetical protein
MTVVQTAAGVTILRWTAGDVSLAAAVAEKLKASEGHVMFFSLEDGVTRLAQKEAEERDRVVVMLADTVTHDVPAHKVVGVGSGPGPYDICYAEKHEEGTRLVIYNVQTQKETASKVVKIPLTDAWCGAAANTFVVSSWGATTFAWNMEDDTMVKLPDVSAVDMNDCMFSLSTTGRFIASTNLFEITVVDTRTGELVRRLRTRYALPAFGNDDDLLFILEDGALRLMSISTGEVVWTRNTPGITSMRLASGQSPCDLFLATRDRAGAAAVCGDEWSVDMLKEGDTHWMTAADKDMVAATVGKRSIAVCSKKDGRRRVIKTKATHTWSKIQEDCEIACKHCMVVVRNAVIIKQHNALQVHSTI